MTVLEELLAQKEALDAEIARIRAEERDKKLNEVKATIAFFGFTSKELFQKAVKKKAAPKYRDPATGKTWSGRGKSPAWFDPDRKEEFLI